MQSRESSFVKDSSADEMDAAQHAQRRQQQQQQRKQYRRYHPKQTFFSPAVVAEQQQV
jgi:hypothetical protein